jgi:hypothetical protein
MFESAQHCSSAVPEFGGFDLQSGGDAIDLAAPGSLGASAAPFIQPCFDDIRAAIARSDWRSAISYARALQCMAGYLDAQPICDAAWQVERLCNEGGHAALDEAMATLCHEMARFTPALLRFMRSAQD